MLLATSLAHPGGVFKLELFLPEEYPMAAPKVTCFAGGAGPVDLRLLVGSPELLLCPAQVRFLTKIYHPNIDKVRQHLG